MTEDKVLKISKDLRNALARLEEALKLEATTIHKDATIQRFEFSFELAWKLMQAVAGFKGKGLDARSPKDSIRVAAQIGLIGNPSEWIEYLKKRNQASHTYDETMADEVYQAARVFLPDGKKLLQSAEKTLTQV